MIKLALAEQFKSYRAKHIVSLILIVSLCTGLLVGIRIHIIRLSYQISQLNKSLSNLNDEIGKTDLKINQEKSPSKLEIMAKNRFQMQPISNTQVITIHQVQKK